MLLAAARLPKYFPLLMTAAGTIPPARVVVMGAGVAGLQAIATARRLGAVVEVSDIRPAVKEQVESLGAKFIELPLAESGEGAGGYAREMGEEFLRQQREIVPAARLRGRRGDHHRPGARQAGAAAGDHGRWSRRMRPGSVIVDLAVEQGGNCELSQADEEVVHGGVLILGPSNLAATMPHDASTLYARNVLALLQLLWKDGTAGRGHRGRGDRRLPAHPRGPGRPRAHRGTAVGVRFCRAGGTLGERPSDRTFRLD